MDPSRQNKKTSTTENLDCVVPTPMRLLLAEKSRVPFHELTLDELNLALQVRQKLYVEARSRRSDNNIPQVSAQLWGFQVVDFLEREERVLEHMGGHF